MTASLLRLLAAAAVYGFSIGASHSWLYAARNLVKFPLLILATAAICAVAYAVLARFLAAPLGLLQVQRTVLAVFRDLAVLLAALSPVSFFLARTIRRPNGADLAEYPFFLLLNTAAIAMCGCLAVARQARHLRTSGCGGSLVAGLLTGWMALSLFAGGQCAWLLRPFFGASPTVDASPPWFAFQRLDDRGAGSFFEAVWNAIRALGR